MSVEVEAEAEEGPRAPVTVTHRPARVSAGLAVLAALVAAFTAGTTSFGLMVGLFGFLGTAVGLFALGSRRLAGLGTGLVFLAVVISGAFGGDEVLVVFGAIAAILAFDLTQNAFGVGEQLSAATETWRGETVHAAGSSAVGVLTVGFSLAVYSLVGGGEFGDVALVFLFLGVLLLLWAIRT